MNIIAYKFLAPNGSYWYINANDRKTRDYWYGRHKLIPLNDDNARSVALLNSNTAPSFGAQECPRVELVGALQTLASHYENALGAFGEDAEALRKAKGDIAHAVLVAAKHNYNGAGCRA